MNCQKMLLISGIAALALSCSQEKEVATREDKLTFHALADCSDEPLGEAAVGVLAGTRTLYLKSSFDKEPDLFWQDAATSSAEAPSSSEIAPSSFVELDRSTFILSS